LEFAPKLPVPVFPLPNVVLFPHAAMPLHIFELRYRTMVREALSGERLLVMALLKPGWESDYHGSPDFHRLGCLARIDLVEWLPNDCYDLRVIGVTRVRIERMTREYPYRAARVEPLPQVPFPEDDPLVAIEKRALLNLCARWAEAPPLPDETRPVVGFGEGLSYEALVNAACVGLPAPPAERLEWLSLDSVIERGRRVRDRVERRLRGRPAAGPTPGGDLN
jgi:uncharacterized protein